MCVEGGMLYQLSYRKVECGVGVEPTVLLLCRQLLWTTQPSTHIIGGHGETRTHTPGVTRPSVFKTAAAMPIRLTYPMKNNIVGCRHLFKSIKLLSFTLIPLVRWGEGSVIP